MSYCGVTILSNNFSGQTVDVTFYPESGGTIYLGSQVFPFTYETDYWWGTYQCYNPIYDINLDITIPEFPTPTPSLTPGYTPTPTPTPSETPVSPTPTPTLTKTPTPSPAVVYVDNLWRGGVMTNVCDEAGYEPSNTIIYSTKVWGTLNVGDFVYGNNTLTEPPILGSGNIISDGAIWIEIDIYSGEIIDIGICP